MDIKYENEPQHEFTILKDCPFCGGRPTLEVTNEGVFVICSNCLVRTQSFKDEICIPVPEAISQVDMAIQIWNDRTSWEERKKEENNASIEGRKIYER